MSNKAKKLQRAQQSSNPQGTTMSDENKPEEQQQQGTDGAEPNQSQAGQDAGDTAAQSGDAPVVKEGANEHGIGPDVGNGDNPDYRPEGSQQGRGQTESIQHVDELAVQETKSVSQAPRVEDKGIQDTTAAAVATPVAPAPTPAVPEVKTTVATTTATAAEAPAPTDFDRLMIKVRETGTGPQRKLVNDLNSYVENMKKGKPITPANGAMQQYALWATLRTVVENHHGDEFRSLWHIVLSFFHYYRDNVFSDRLVFRFADHWQRDKDQLKALQRLLDLIKITADPATRDENKKRVDMARSLEVGFSEEARSRVLQYYGR
jgi:hypothetical protein